MLEQKGLLKKKTFLFLILCPVFSIPYLALIQATCNLGWGKREERRDFIKLFFLAAPVPPPSRRRRRLENILAFSLAPAACFVVVQYDAKKEAC